jgi:DNA invertase Pin-like site-specific DNA recombinase
MVRKRTQPRVDGNSAGRERFRSMSEPAAIYCRISKDVAGTRGGVQRQEVECRGLADRLGLEVGGVFVDNDISAYRNAPRPAWIELSERIRIGEFRSLISWHPDRLTRHPLQLEALVELLELTGTRVYTVSAGEYDLGTATGRMCARVVGAVARHESEHKSERIRVQTRQDAYAGKARNLGTRPFGFEKNGIDHRPGEVKAIRKAVRQVFAGKTLTYIAAQMPPGTRGRPLKPPELKTTLLNPRMAGFRTYHGEIVAVGEWDPIIEPETWRALCRALTEGNIHHHKTPYNRYLLTNVAVDYRGVFLHGATDHGRRGYRTNTNADGSGIAIRADALDAMVLAALREQQYKYPNHPARLVNWDELTLARRQTLLRDSFESIIVYPPKSMRHCDRGPAERVVIAPRPQP